MPSDDCGLEQALREGSPIILLDRDLNVLASSATFDFQGTAQTLSIVPGQHASEVLESLQVLEPSAIELLLQELLALSPESSYFEYDGDAHTNGQAHHLHYHGCVFGEDLMLVIRDETEITGAKRDLEDLRDDYLGLLDIISDKICNDVRAMGAHADDAGAAFEAHNHTIAIQLIHAISDLGSRTHDLAANLVLEGLTKYGQEGIQREPLQLYKDVIAPALQDPFVVANMTDRQVTLSHDRSMKKGEEYIVPGDRHALILAYKNLFLAGTAYAPDSNAPEGAGYICYGGEEHESHYELNVFAQGEPFVAKEKPFERTKGDLIPTITRRLGWAKSIVESHNGQIRVGPGLYDDGMNVVFTLPKE